MKKYILAFGLFLSICSLANDSKKSESKGISYISKIPTTAVQDQSQTNTCWSFAGISLLETELIRNGKGVYDLSEMFIVHQNYLRKAQRYIRMRGNVNFAAGGEPNDVTDVLDQFGIVPEKAYSGLLQNENMHSHLKMDKILKTYVDNLVSEADSNFSPDWNEGFQSILQNYIGEMPPSFKYEGNIYTPESFANQLEISPSDYIMLTSFTHAPLYAEMIIEVPDNWSWAKSYNLPLDVLEKTVDSALTAGYSVAWAADISEEGFNFDKGFALAPKIFYETESQDQGTKPVKEKKIEKVVFDLDRPIEEVQVTAQNRQEAFDNFTTTDDHSMHIVGLARDTNGRSFYYVKNSWGTDNPFQGFLHVSKPYFKYKTISVFLNKKALPIELQQKLSL